MATAHRREDWRRLHYTTFFVFAAGLLHGILAGSDGDTMGMYTLYVSSVIVVGALGAYRALVGAAFRAGRPRP